MKHDLKSRLHRAVKIILTQGSEIFELAEAIQGLKEVFQQLSPVKAEAGYSTEVSAKQLTFGLAIGPEYAAIVLTDIMRTVKFLRGVDAAVNEALKRFEGRPVHLLYAGCGPYATIVLPLLHRFTPEELSVSLIDVHPVSLRSAENLFQALGAAAFLRGVYCDDASRFRLSEDETVHIVVSETMSQELRREPQVSITMNLAPQMVDGGIFIPEEIAISLQAVHSRNEYKRKMGSLPEKDKDKVQNKLGDIFILDKFLTMDSVVKTDSDDYLPANSVSIPEEDFGYNQLMLFTEINIFNGISLHPYESSLTGPLNLRRQENVKPGQRLFFRYLLGENPHFVYE